MSSILALSSISKRFGAIVVANGIDLLSNNDLANSRALALDET